MGKKEKEPQVFRPKAGDRIICQSGPMRYEARVLNTRKAADSQDKNLKMEFFVHYQGWNKNWDEWVGEERVHQFNEANVAVMKEMKSDKSKNKSGSNSSRKKLGGQKETPSNIDSISSQSSVAESITVELEEPIQLDKDVKIKIPDELKNWLVDDDNNIKNKKLTNLPAKPSISTILKEFVLHKKNTHTKGATDKEFIYTELTLGIRDYFNVMLGPHLLYKFERLQYQNLLKENGKDVELTQHYGVIHLVRLFTRIGKYLAVTSLDSQSIQTLVNYIQELLKFITKQPNLFDLEKNYTVAPPEYIKNALK